MTLRLRLRRSWTSWSLKRILRRQAKAERELQLLLLLLDSQRLHLTGLDEKRQLLEFQQRELEEATAYRLEGLLPDTSSPKDGPLQLLN